MEENEMLEQANETENVDTQATEEFVEELVDGATEEVAETEPEILPIKKIEMTQEEFDEKVKLRLRRQERQYQKELSKRDGLIEKLKVGMGKDDLDEIDTELTSFYETQGVKLPRPSAYNERDEVILAKAEAEEIIASGFEEMEREANELAKISPEKRTTREKTLIAELVNKLMYETAKKDLSQKGIDTTILDNKEFKDFVNKFAVNTPIAEVYDIYEKTHKQEKQTPKPIGSVKTTTADNSIKDFYTYEESLKFTQEDYDKNPKLFEAVENSMLKW